MPAIATGVLPDDLVSRLVAHRRARRAAVAAVHIALWSCGFAVAVVLRYEGDFASAIRAGCIPLLAVLVVARLAAFQSLRLFDGLFRYAGLGELRRIVAASTAATLAALGAKALFAPFAARSLLLGELLASIAAVGGIRMLVRAVYERQRRGGPRTRTLVIGANDTGESLLRDLSRGDGGYQVIGFLDEDPDRVGSDVHEVPVLGLADEKTLQEVIVARDVQEVVFAMPDVASSSVRQLVARARRLGARTVVVPSLAERLAAPMEMVRDIVIEDLLGREPVRLDQRLLDSFLGDKVVLVTGAGGSIGSELSRQVLRFGPRALLLFDHDENALFFIERELRAAAPEATLVAIAGDMTHARGVAAVFERYGPQVVLHAAAHKHVGMMEHNACEAARNNIFGTQVLAEAAHEAVAEAFVLISTDKAVNPTSVMGATKRVCEMEIQHIARGSQTRFAAVRFGNVLGSNGSVVPIFTEQIARGGPVTVRHPEVQRYFMTIPEAAGLVLQAGALGGTGKIFLLDMGAPVRIADLARLLIEMHGLRPGIDIQIHYSGLLPGEKLYEELLLEAEAVDEVRPHPKIVVGRIAPPSEEELLEGLMTLRSAVALADEAMVRAVLSRLVPQAHLAPANAGPPPRRRDGNGHAAPVAPWLQLPATPAASSGGLQ